VDIYRVQNGLIAEDWHLEDNLTLMQQLGIVAFLMKSPFPRLNAAC